MKPIEIEELLRWAYRQELPKAGSGTVRSAVAMNGWGPMNDYERLLTVVDDDGRNAWGCVADLSAESDPHPDALIVGRTVQAMAGIDFAVAEDWDGLADLRCSDGSPLTGAERADCHARGRAMALDTRAGRMPGLIVRHAILGGAPEWLDYGPVRRVFVRNAQGGTAWFRQAERCDGEGRPGITIEIDGYDRRRQRPFPGAYRKTVLAPDPARLVRDRLTYQAYLVALAELTARLQAGTCGDLTAHRVEGSPRALWPWEAEGERFAAGCEIVENDTDARHRRAAG
ncbi:hypothetical protein [Jiella marina]|uniref:hypothetical protein n=1 Tax=Jiella sp. LLJ827 TaxID=2917712 RepID=UPI002100A330|nr:hypothetical protein [Jiella sp. LLJ827]MCQ0986415.1 hypothetical protein [Jiella sp. LLJ827]